MKSNNSTSLNKIILDKLEKELGLSKGSLKGDERLKEFKAWDSLAIVMLITLLDKKLHIATDPVEIASAETVHDLINVVNSKLSLCVTPI